MKLENRTNCSLFLKPVRWPGDLIICKVSLCDIFYVKTEIRSKVAIFCVETEIRPKNAMFCVKTETISKIVMFWFGLTVDGCIHLLGRQIGKRVIFSPPCYHVYI